ncbi:MAG: 2-amino-4-hydroxy-6-hydroxymethyldihydropteridine diphosphokinase [Oscillospiraceae bacterium]|jgi:2-amino-4-hydroxy-6-hydroxymethyldihydropteridine diphosphokinase|nr:2-amino-4-hydroxy-6-hydroxymethyldihydropteridine diphosphokinase [Oscillospiraceae bacterium]
MSEAVVGLGSNLGKKNENLLQAVQALSRLPGSTIKRISSIFVSPPEGAPTEDAQEEYHNMAVLLETTMSPMALLGACLGVEAAMGRVRTHKNAARPIDLDLLLYEGIKSESFELSLPHPRLLQRAFTLLPLKELYPSGRAPGIFFEPHLRELDLTGIRRLERRIEMN